MKSDTSGFAFDRFVLDTAGRRLLLDGAAVELSNRCFDALSLLVADAGGLVTKDRFMTEVWRGVPVTDEALTQCIKTLRRALGDNAARPRFIETVPKHGYRFAAVVTTVGQGDVTQSEPTAPTPTPHQKGRGFREIFLLGGAGVIGGGIAGLIGGIFYGFVGATQPLQAGMGAGSIVLVLTALSVLIALVGAAGVSFGIAVALVADGRWSAMVVGGAIGGLLIGGIVKLLGLDAFNLLLGQSPVNVTGAVEGAALGGAVGLGVWLGGRSERVRIWPAALVGGVAGAAITAAGGRLLAGSLDLMAQIFPQSRLKLDQFGALFGENDFGRISQIVTGGLEGMLFAACIAAAMLLVPKSVEPHNRLA